MITEKMGCNYLISAVSAISKAGANIYRAAGAKVASSEYVYLTNKRLTARIEGFTKPLTIENTKTRYLLFMKIKLGVSIDLEWE